MSDSESERAEVARLLTPRISLKAAPSDYPFLTQSTDQQLVKTFLEAENAPVPVYIEMNPLDTRVDQNPIDQAYDEFTYAMGRHLDLFYYRKGLSQPLEAYGEKIYEGWTAIFPDPLQLSFVKELAGDNDEEAERVLKQALLADSALAQARYRRNVQNSQDEEGFWKPVHARKGLVTFESVVNQTVRFDNFSRWSSHAYILEVAQLRQLKAVMRAAQDTLYSYPFLDDPGFTYETATEGLHLASNAATEGLQKFLRKKIVVHIA